MKYLPIIGIEVHIELKTDSKMFCGCKAHHFRVKPNTHTCPVCLGLPGALPVPNQKAIEWCLLTGKALACQIAEESKFDRKNYFYPDLPKGYQISQYDMPFCRNGKITLQATPYKLHPIRINRVHMEEDTAKLLHRIIKGEKCSLIDFNRSGVPLVEVVTEPDLHSSEEAVAYLKKLQQIIRYLEVSDCDMEKGSMRCEINISLRSKQKTVNSNEELPKYKVEVKNINSFKFVKKAIDYEIKRQTELLEKGETPLQETRGFNENKQKTYSQRGKEEAHDYRYFPEPDIPAVKAKSLKLKAKSLPELPDKKRQRFIKEYGLNEYSARLLTTDRQRADVYENILEAGGEAKDTANLIINKRIDINKFTPKEVVNYLEKQKADKVSDQGELEKILSQILKNNPKAVEDYKKGKKEVISFLIGQVMKETKGKADAALVRKLLIRKLS